MKLITTLILILVIIGGIDVYSQRGDGSGAAQKQPATIVINEAVSPRQWQRLTPEEKQQKRNSAQEKLNQLPPQVRLKAQQFRQALNQRKQNIDLRSRRDDILDRRDNQWAPNVTVREKIRRVR